MGKRARPTMDDIMVMPMLWDNWVGSEIPELPSV